MKNFIYAILIYINISNCVAQNESSKIIENVIQSTILIENFDSSLNIKGNSSGILVNDSSKLYIVTAKHCIMTEENNYQTLISPFIQVRFYAKNFKSDSSNLIIIDLYKLRNSNFIRVDSINDICVLIIGDAKVNAPIRYYAGVERLGYGVNFAPYPLFEDYVFKKEQLYLGEDVFVAGFPSSLGLKYYPQFDYFKPLLKKGIVGGVSNNFSTFVIDCPVYPGNSGGPVFLDRKDFYSREVRLIGIEYIPYISTEILIGRSGNYTSTLIDQTSSYAVVVPIERVFELIK